ncbi:slipin family protein [uncultured Aquimarina sp.]|uniref:slipin family protein n=1 Tax=uncultured Aquimarina sp. TaxID=575652 RepID=UPI0026146C8A|nr:slipin family protein [uncultured Aquimarina sp.]
MKRVRINAGKVGLVFRKGDYNRVITQGIYWLGFNESAMQYDLSKPFATPIALELLLKDKELEDMLHVIEVKDSEIVLVYENGNFKSVFTAGRYTLWKGLYEYEFTRIDLSKIYITEKINKSLFSNYALNKYVRVFEVAAYEKAVLIVDDIYAKTLESGTYRFWRNDTTIEITKADLRQLQLEIAGQELLTKDKAAIRINFYTQYKVVDIEKALLDNKEYEKQLYIVMQLALRAFVGNYSLDELLERKDSMANIILETTKGQAIKLGVKVLNCGIRDIILTGEMKEIMNQVLVAQKKAQANIITRREETASTRSLLNTAKLMEDNEMLYKLKEMEYVEKIADKIGEISLSGNGNMIKQLKDIFSVNR